MILVVEDHDDLRGWLLSFLKREGFEAWGARDGVSALEAMKLVVPNLVLLDLALPYVHGWEVRRRMLSKDALRLVPVVVLTGVPVTPEGVKALRVNACLSKPIGGAELLATIRRFLPKD